MQKLIPLCLLKCADDIYIFDCLSIPRNDLNILFFKLISWTLAKTLIAVAFCQKVLKFYFTVAEGKKVKV